jgi:hypothetical protein
VPNNIDILEYTREASIWHNIYKHILGTKPKHARGQVTYNIENPLILHEVAKSPMTSTYTY